MNILIVSGFLGSGKTTFIKALAKKTKKELVIMENEYGETGVDGNILEQDRLKVWELTEGCICCSLKSDFAMSILTIANTLDPKILVVEPTGVGLLSSIIKNISKIEYGDIKLLEPITIVDINCFDYCMSTFNDLYIDQIKNTKKIVFSKLECANKSSIEKVRLNILNINEKCEIISTPYQNLKDSWWEGIISSFNSNHDIHDINIKDTTVNLENISFEDIYIKTIDQLIDKMIFLIQGRFGKIVRVKGFTPINGQWAKFDIVGQTYSIETCNPMKKSKIVIIGHNLNKSELKILFYSRN